MLLYNIKKHRQTILLCLLTGLFATLFPYLVTLTLNKDNFSPYNPSLDSISLSGKCIRLTESNAEMDIEYFIPLIVYSMMPVTTEKEALKAQFIITRTYLHYILGKEDSLLSENISLPYTSYKELEKKWGENYSKYYNYTMTLLAETNGQKMYFKNQIICPYYHELSAGVTNSGDEEYLSSVKVEEDEKSEGLCKIFYFTKDELIQKLNGLVDAENEIDLATIFTINFSENEKYVRSISINNQTISAKDFMNMLGLSSTAFTIEPMEDTIKITCLGIGDGLGLSVCGSIAMAKNGKSAAEILTYFYKDIEIQ